MRNNFIDILFPVITNEGPEQWIQSKPRTFLIMDELKGHIFDSNETLFDQSNLPKRVRKKYSVRFNPEIEHIQYFDKKCASNDMIASNRLILIDNDCETGSVSQAVQNKYQLMSNGNCYISLGVMYGTAKVWDFRVDTSNAMQVFCRFTTNEWLTWSEIKMELQSSKINLNYFQFKYQLKGSCCFRYCFRIEMNETCWDNNGGLNYCSTVRETKRAPENHQNDAQEYRDNATLDKMGFRDTRTQKIDQHCFRDRHQFHPDKNWWGLV